MPESQPQFEDQKAALRIEAFAKRAKIPAADRADAANIASMLFFESVPLEPGQVVAAYWPIRDEIDCKPILTRLVDSGQQVCLPVVMGDAEPLQLRVWEPGQPLYPSGFGTLAPPETAPQAVPDVVIIPLLGFDRLGTRLGYGKGYYDRTLARMKTAPLLVGLAFAAQELDYIPRAPHDMPLDILVTDAGVHKFEAS